jgi:hypothetical protein
MCIKTRVIPTSLGLVTKKRSPSTGAAEKSRPMNVANAVRALAVHLYDAGELETSAPLWEEARETYCSFGINAGVAECSIRLARIARHRGDDALAAQRLAEAKAAAEESGDEDTVAYVLSVAKEIW